MSSKRLFLVTAPLFGIATLMAYFVYRVAVHSSATLNPIQTIDEGLYSGEFGSVAVLPGGGAVIGTRTQYRDGKPSTDLRLVDLKTGQVTNLDTRRVSGGIAVVSQDGATVVVVYRDGQLEIWDLETRAVRRTLPSAEFDQLAFCTTGEYVYLAQKLGDGAVYRLNVRTGVTRQVFGLGSQIHVDRSTTRYGGQIRSLAPLNGGRELFIGMPLGAVVWSVTAGRELSYFLIPDYAECFATNHTETQVAVAGPSGMALLDIKTGRKIEEIARPVSTDEMPATRPCQMVYSGDDAFLAGNVCAGVDMPGYVAVWRARDFLSPRVFRCDDCPVGGIAFLPRTHKLITVAARDDGPLKVWDLDQLFADKR